VKVVFASTPGQEEKVKELVQYVYSNIFPRYFSDREISEFERHNVLRASTSRFEAFDTLKDAYKVITCLQTIISILEVFEPKNDYQCIFDKNVSMLTELGLYFPFTYDQFKNTSSLNGEMLSVYVDAANEWLV
jgi:hypothetical protein